MIKKIVGCFIGCAALTLLIAGTVLIATDNGTTDTASADKSEEVVQSTEPTVDSELKKVVDGKTINLDEHYDDITSIEIGSGTTGEVKIIEDKESIDKITSTLHGEMYEVKEKPYKGWCYRLKFNKDKVESFNFDTMGHAFEISFTEIGTYYASNNFDVHTYNKLIKEIFDNHS